MTRLVTDGAEMGDLLDLSVPRDQVEIKTDYVRSGNYSYGVGTGGFKFLNTGASIYFTASTEIYMRCAWLIVGPPGGTTDYESITLRNSDGTNYCSWRGGSDRWMHLYNATSAVYSFYPLLNTWYLLEIHLKVHDTTGILQLKIDGVLVYDFTGDTKPGSTTTVNELILGEFLYYNTDSYGIRWDDIAVNDVNGSVDNSWVGDGHIVVLTPNANGDVTQLDGSDGNQVDNYLLVDERPADNDSTYVEGTTIDGYDLYNLSASGLSTVDIQRVQVKARARNTVATGEEVALVLKTNSNEYDSSDIVLSTTYGKCDGPEYTTNPQTSSAWTVSELDALQIGPKTR